MSCTLSLQATVSGPFQRPRPGHTRRICAAPGRSLRTWEGAAAMVCAKTCGFSPRAKSGGNCQPSLAPWRACVAVIRRTDGTAIRRVHTTVEEKEPCFASQTVCIDAKLALVVSSAAISRHGSTKTQCREESEAAEVRAGGFATVALLSELVLCNLCSAHADSGRYIESAIRTAYRAAPHSMSATWRITRRPK